jgi:hypothetical protein
MLVDETITGYNTFVKEQIKEGPGRVTLVLFDDKYEMVYEDTPLAKVPPLTREVYYERGWTALLDAVGKTVNHVRERHLSDKPDKTIVFITTDGEENWSKEFDYDQIKDLIKECESEGWVFFFMGAGINAFQVGSMLGIAQANIASTDPSKKGTAAAYAAASHFTATARSDDEDDASLQDLYEEEEEEED